MTAGFQILPEFRVVQHERDVAVLYAMKSYFGCGVVRKNHDTRMEYRVRSLDHLLHIIIPFFEAHPLHTKKSADFHSFARVLRKMQQGKHRTKEGIREIFHIVKGMNRRSRALPDGLDDDPDDTHSNDDG